MSRDNNRLPMLPPWLIPAEGPTPSGYEQLDDEGPRRGRKPGPAQAAPEVPAEAEPGVWRALPQPADPAQVQSSPGTFGPPQSGQAPPPATGPRSTLPNVLRVNSQAAAAANAPAAPTENPAPVAAPAPSSKQASRLPSALTHGVTPDPAQPAAGTPSQSAAPESTGRRPSPLDLPLPASEPVVQPAPESATPGPAPAQVWAVPAQPPAGQEPSPFTQTAVVHPGNQAPAAPANEPAPAQPPQQTWMAAHQQAQSLPPWAAAPPPAAAAPQPVTTPAPAPEPALPPAEAVQQPVAATEPAAPPAEAAREQGSAPAPDPEEVARPAAGPATAASGDETASEQPGFAPAQSASAAEEAADPTTPVAEPAAQPSAPAAEKPADSPAAAPEHGAKAQQPEVTEKLTITRPVPSDEQPSSATAAQPATETTAPSQAAVAPASNAAPQPPALEKPSAAPQSPGPGVPSTQPYPPAAAHPGQPSPLSLPKPAAEPLLQPAAPVPHQHPQAPGFAPPAPTPYGVPAPPAPHGQQVPPAPPGPHIQQAPHGQASQGGGGAPHPSIEEVPLLRRARKSPEKGWRRTVHHLSRGTIHPGQSADALRLRDLIERVRQPTQGDYRIAVLSLKGGVGKTTTTVGLGSTFASMRGDRVIAVDANPDLGTLSMRIPLQTRSTVRDLLNAGEIQRYSDVRAHTSQSASRLEVLASDRDPAASEAFSEADYRQTINILQRFYNIVITDCGTGLMHSAMDGVLGLAHALVLVTSPAIDGARSAAATLDWLNLHGYEELVRHSVVVLSAAGAGTPNIDMLRLRQYFLSRCRAVHAIPFDDHLAEGAEVDLDKLGKEARYAFIELAASLGDKFFERT